MTANKTMKRYDMEGAAGGAVAMEDDTGEWVRYEDAMALVNACVDQIILTVNAVADGFGKPHITATREDLLAEIEEALNERA